MLEAAGTSGPLVLGCRSKCLGPTFKSGDYGHERSEPVSGANGGGRTPFANSSIVGRRHRSLLSLGGISAYEALTMYRIVGGRRLHLSAAGQSRAIRRSGDGRIAPDSELDSDECSRCRCAAYYGAAGVPRHDSHKPCGWFGLRSMQPCLFQCN
jgi:hypothetical protein